MIFPKNTAKTIFLIALIGLLPFNITSTIKKSLKMKKVRDQKPYHFAGYEFLGLEKILKGQEYAGYFTDKDITVPQNNMEYSQAQFILAPTILEINNTTHKYTFFDCSSPQICIEKIKEIGLIPLKRSKQGIILTEKRP